MKSDTLEHWLSYDPILKQGEIAVVFDAGNQMFKVGDGESHFTELQYSYSQKFQTEQLSSTQMTAETVTQGLNNNVTGMYACAHGYRLSANARFSQVFGNNAESISGDAFSMVWNGKSSIMATDRYQSHGTGTANFNPVDGVSGFYIGDNSLDSILTSREVKTSDAQNKINIGEDKTMEVNSLDTGKLRNGTDTLLLFGGNA